MADLLAERRRQQEALVAAGRDYVERLSRRLPIVGAIVAGSVARGDFNVWSDVDVVVVADGLPPRLPDRLSVLFEDVAGGVQPAGFTPEEFERALAKGNPLVSEALERGLILAGDDFFRRYEPRPIHSSPPS